VCRGGADELGRLLGTCAGRGFEERRDLALMSFLLDTGARGAEIVGVKLENVDGRSAGNQHGELGREFESEDPGRGGQEEGPGCEGRDGCPGMPLQAGVSERLAPANLGQRGRRGRPHKRHAKPHAGKGDDFPACLSATVTDGSRAGRAPRLCVSPRFGSGSRAWSGHCGRACRWCAG
jgi:hypothetical protein